MRFSTDVATLNESKSTRVKNMINSLYPIQF